MTPRIVIVAAYASVRAGLAALLTGAGELVGASSGSAPLEALLADAPADVIVFDDAPADRDAVLRSAAGGGAGLVLLTDERDAVRVLSDAALPAWAALLRDADADALAGAVQAVLAGLIVFDRALVPSPSLTLAASPAPPGASLTARERDVLHWLARGLPNKQIAVRLGVSAHTVKFHVASILAKLGATSRTEAVTLGARRGDVLL